MVNAPDQQRLEEVAAQWESVRRWRCVGPWIILCVAAAGAGGWVLGANTEVGEFFRNLGLSLGDSMANLVAETITWWMDATEMSVSDCRNPSDEACVTASGAIGQLQQHTLWLVGTVAVGSLLFVGIRMVLSRDSKSFADTAKGFMVFVLVMAVGVGVVELLLRLGDGYASWIIDQTSVNDGGDDDDEDDLGQRLGQNVVDTTESVMDDDDDSEHGGWTVLAVFVLFFGLLASLFQFVIMAARAAALVLIVGLLPVAAAAGLTEGGRAMRQKYFAWLIALVLYKPTAATIWAAAFFLLDDDELEGIFGLMTLVSMMILALVALPALMRLVTPAVAAASSSGGGSGGGVAAAGMLATGAIQAGAMRGGGAAARGASASGSSGGVSGKGSSASGSRTTQSASARTGATGSDGSKGAASATKAPHRPGGSGSASGAATQASAAIGSAQSAHRAINQVVDDAPSGADESKGGER
ncbi:hypothetical protein [Natronoglycomyces albus]|uniref:TrbL/VirB6 plasmid conjugal transfer protein n=1 Tax=Natronoglycomyces albus TaxID=2811108 RepID=A0A895XUX5_9ACTN|nr:hypothetical protein [Natronoglycomyces albus]QSB07185.1 hypothetical protein JQS30_16915 [Natronoglycomyces albus]